MSRRVARARGQDGFTLVELLVVIAILGILSGVVVFAVRGIGDKGRGVAVATDERILRTAEESYCAQNGRYAAEYELVRDGFLTGPSEYHAIVVGDDPDDRLVFPDPTVSTGNCGETFKHYQIVCRDGSPMPNCGEPSGPPTSTTVPPSSTWALLSQGPPSARYEAAMAEYPPGNNLVMFGGRGPLATSGVGVYAGETWAWSGIWTLAAPPAVADCEGPPLSKVTPCPRSGHVMAYDAFHQEVVMVGGRFEYNAAGDNSRQVTLRETWKWKGSWTLAKDGAEVPQSFLGAMAYDAERRNVVLFGGMVDAGGGGMVPSGATWIWNGTSWSEASGPGPSPRWGSSMAYDPAGRRVILFGGQAQNPDRYLAETWAWNGTTWAQLAPHDSPSARTLAAMATMGSGSTGSVVLFGGIAVVTPSEGPVPDPYAVLVGGEADTWVWDGPHNTWVVRHPIQSPVGRAYVPLAYHQATDQLVMFGGNQVVGASADTWGYKSTPAPTTTLPPTTVP